MTDFWPLFSADYGPSFDTPFDKIPVENGRSFLLRVTRIASFYTIGRP
jgi:hypothetical protein